MRGPTRTIAAALGLALAGYLALAHKATADRVPVRAGVHQGYGRIVFDWPGSVGHSASVDGRALTIRFDRPIESGFGAVQRTLAGYVDRIAVDPDGKTVRATLKSDFRMRSFRAGNRVVVDLLGQDAATGPGETAGAAPAAAPRPLGPAARVAGPAQVAVRMGRTEQYGRLIFAWPRKVPFSVDRQGQTVTIRFSAPGAIDVDHLRRNLPPQISAAVVRPDPQRLDVGLVVAPDAQLRYFHNGADVVFDVVGPAPAAAPPQPPRRLGPVARPGGKGAATAERGAAAKAKTPVDSGPLISVDAARRGAEMTVRFNWRVPVNAAVFRRDNALWVAFDRPGRIDLNAVRVAGRGLFEDVAQKPLTGGAAVRIAMTLLYDVAVRRDGTLWVVEIGPGRKKQSDPFALRIERAPNAGTLVSLPATDPGPVLVLADPEIGDSLYIVPLPDPGLGTHALRRFAEFELLDSAQGVAVRPLDERVRVSRDDTRVVVSRPGGLTLSDSATLATGAPQRKRAGRLLDFNGWLYGPPEDFKAIEAELFQYVTQRDGLKRSAARLGLARFYVAHGMAAEAIGVIGALERDDGAMLRDPGFRALRGVARYLIGHYADASAEFDHPLLRGEREIDPWRGAIAAARGDWAGAHRLFVGADSLIAQYPPRFAVPFGLTAAEAALSVDDLGTAGVRLSVLESAPATGPQLDRIAYLRGHLLKKQDEAEKAIALWQSVIAQGDRPTRAKAAFALINTLYDTKKMPLVEAIERLEQLRFAWRNDVFEFDLLQRLGMLYAENKDIRAALVTLRQAATYFKDIKGAQALTQEMRRLFYEFYRNGDADSVAPVTALGLFDEFRELTPPGADGDRMIRRLADRLIAVDLLADAADLLDHLVRFRLQAEEKAETGTRLAEIRLADRKYDKALEALAISRADKIDSRLAGRRHYLAVNAHTDAGRLDEAMRLIGNESSDAADSLRARVQWRLGKWKDAARTLARLTAAFPTDKVDETQADMLLRRAVALALSGNNEGAAFLRERFGEAMANGPRAAAFRAVVGRDPLQTDDFAELARQAAELDTFGPFIEKIRGARPGAPAAGAAALGANQTAEAVN